MMGRGHAARVQAKTSKRSRLRTGASSVGRAAKRRAARHSSPAPAVRSEWTSFVTRCLRSWLAAQQSATDFLANWTPLGLPAFGPSRPARHRGRRKASHVAGRRSRRAGHQMAVATAPAIWLAPVAAAGSAAALRARYPLVNALLLELAASPRGDLRAGRSQRGA